MRGQEEDVKKTLGDPDLVKQSIADPNVLLFYRPRQEGGRLRLPGASTEKAS